MSGADLLEIRAGARAMAHLRDRGLAPADIACIPAAAGGPKGLALLPFDRLLAGEWLPAMNGAELIGASIGAWRMAALAQPDAMSALDRLQHAYVRDQNYDQRPTPAQVSQGIRRLAHAAGGDHLSTRAGLGLSIITTRARGPLAGRHSRAAFGRAALSNAVSRRGLAAHMERVVFQSGENSCIGAAFDAFGLTCVALSDANLEDALLASGSIPLLCEPVRDLAGAPRGDYWDGGLIDYHLLLPYERLGGLVLYPHFVPYVTPGWLDKFLPWRQRPRAHPWLSNVLLIAPSRAMLGRLPNSKLPDRSDFHRYGLDHPRRIRDWERAISESQRFADAAMAWLARPDLSLVRPL
jgi:hypothetical protein